MNSNIWGPHAWHFIHAISFNYPINPTQQDREKYYEFFNSLSYVLPCGTCQEAYRKKLQKLNILDHLNSRELLVEFVIKLHNLVNKDLNKPLFNKEQAIELYTNLYSPENNKEKNITVESENNNIIIYIILIIIIILIYYYIKYKRI